MPDIFDEVEEEVRAERMRRLLQRYAGLILGAVLLVVAGLAGWRIRDHYQAQQDRGAAAQYLAALNQAQGAGATAAEATRAQAVATLAKLAEGAPSGYRQLARLRLAALLAQAGKRQQALDLYNALATDQSADPLLRDLASLLWAEHQIDDGDPQLLEARLKPLAAPDSPWRPLAERQLALLDLRQNRTASARDILRRLAVDGAAPSGVRESAQLLLQQIGS
ncbi:MAG: tetratricopeptide repeat protein [Acetobacteraceae bacterium]|nr:tetratricopeptide repeat protein [Acetobacteraceae bacterium]